MNIIPLIEAPFNVPLKIIEITGGVGVRRRLLTMGFNRGDVLELDSRAILNGPLIVRNVTHGTRTAIGRGVAFRILVFRADEAK